MRKHLVSLLAGLTACGVLAAATGCQKKVVPPEPIPASGPIPLNHFVRVWAQTPTLAAEDSIKELHARDKDLFVYTNSGQVLVMARDTGRLRWVAQIRATDRGGMRPPVVLSDKVVIPTSSTLEVFEPNDGQLIKSVPLTVASRSKAIGQGNNVYLGGDSAGSGRVVALDVTRPYVPTVWELMIPKGGLQSTPALFDDVLFIGGGDGDVYAVSAAGREAIWPLAGNVFKTEGPISADVAADESGVYVASTDTRFYCINRGSGRLKWQYYGGRPLTGNPVLTKTHVYLPVPDAGIACFNKGDGEFNRRPEWLAVGMSKFLAEDDKHAYLLRAADNKVVAIEKATGEHAFESNRGDLTAFASNRVGTDGTVYAASKTNRIIAIKPVLRPGVVGELVWNEADADTFALAK